MTSKLTETDWSPVAERCPSCFEDDCLEPVYIEQDVYYVCRECGNMTGIDDTTADDDRKHCTLNKYLDQEENISIYSTVTDMTSKSIETPWSPVAERCRSCFKDDCLEPVYIDHDVYYVCRKCDYMTGIDDTMTDDDLLAAFLVTESWDVDDCGRGTRSGVSGVKINIAVCAGCGNDDINLLSIADCDKTTGNVLLQCLVCDEKMMVSIDQKNNDGLNAMAEMDSSSELAGAVSTATDEDSYFFYDDDRAFDDSEVDYLSSSMEVIDESEVQRPTSLTCSRCDNQTEELFAVEWDQVTGELMTIHCQVCDGIDIFNDLPSSKTVAPVYSDGVDDSPPVTQHSYVECTHCGNIRDEMFSKRFDDNGNRLLSLKCLACSKLAYFHNRHSDTVRRQTSNSVKVNENNNRTTPHRRSDVGRGRDHRPCRRAEHGAVAIGRERISNLDRLRRGDHISWHKWYAIWHHAIVVEADAGHGRVTVIHNSGTVKPLDGKIASVRLETIEVDPVREDLYQYVYHSRRDPDGGVSTCYPPDEVVQRAASRLRQTYNPFTFNCEHFARWCKTGYKKSEQVKKFVGRVTNATATSLRGLGGATSNAARRVKGGPLGAGLVASIAVEGANFAVEAKEAYRKYRAGEISKDDFRQQLAKHGCEVVGGLAASTICGVVGQLVIPVPFIGGFIGSTLGNLVGRWCGAMIGKQMVKVK